MGVSHGMFAIVLCALLPVGRGIDGPYRASALGSGPWTSRTGRWACPLLRVNFDLFPGRVGRSKVRPWQLMRSRQATPVCADCGTGGKATKV